MKNTIQYTLLSLALVLSTPAMAKKVVTSDTLKAKATQTQQQAAKISVNSASAETLSKGLKGIGPSKALAIIAYRRANGPFKSIADLAQVKGIGVATIEKNIKVLSL